jgi:RNA polymerase sigma factor (sigma-70 family)
MTDSEILAGIQSGNDRALALLYKEHYKMVSHFVMGNSGTEDEAKDVYQEAVILFYEKVSARVLQLNCKISTYLYSVCRRIWLRKLAGKKNYSGQVEEFEEFIRIDEETEDYSEDDFKTMSASLGMLGEPCRGIIEDYYLQNKSMQQICDKFGYTNADNAKNQKYKCLMRLKKVFFGMYQGNNH